MAGTVLAVLVPGTASAGTMMGQVEGGRKVRCHNGAVEIFWGSRNISAARSKAPLLAKNARNGAPDGVGMTDRVES